MAQYFDPTMHVDYMIHRYSDNVDWPMNDMIEYMGGIDCVLPVK